MNQDRQQQAEQLTTSLDLSLPPVAVSFVDLLPDGVAEYGGSVPAGCVFWQEAARRTFATSAKHHALCSIGIHTMNLSQAPASQPEELRTALEAMMGLDYVREAEVAAIPVVRHEVNHALYGPLGDFPVEPDVVLLFANARQGLVLSEALGRVDGGVPPAMGRPACAAVPQALNHGIATMSLGAAVRGPISTRCPTTWRCGRCRGIGSDSTASKSPHSRTPTGRSRCFTNAGERTSRRACVRPCRSRSSGSRDPLDGGRMHRTGRREHAAARVPRR